jgi:hypothetical protein
VGRYSSSGQAARVLAGHVKPHTAKPTCTVVQTISGLLYIHQANPMAFFLLSCETDYERCNATHLLQVDRRDVTWWRGIGHLLEALEASICHVSPQITHPAPAALLCSARMCTACRSSAQPHAAVSASTLLLPQHAVSTSLQPR